MNRSQVPFALVILVISVINFTARAGQEALAGTREGAEDAAPRLELLDAGQEPRRLLAYRIGPELRQVTTIRVNMDRQVTLPNMKPLEVAIPPMELAMDIDGRPDGDLFRIRGVVTRAVPKGKESEDLSATADMLKELVGSEISMMWDRRGILSEPEIKLTKDIEPRLRQMLSMLDSMRNIPLHFPGVDVGVGAVWKVTIPVQADGITSERVTHYTLNAFNGELLELAMKTEQIAGSQRVEAVPGMAVELVSMSILGEGVTVLDPRRPSPLRSDFTVRTSLRTRPVRPLKGEEDMSMKQETTARVTMESRDRE